MSERTCVSLFSGIGGLDLGLARAGFRHLAFCESDAYRRDVLSARWPGVLVFDDVAGVCAGDDGSWPPGIGARRRALGGSERGTAADGSLSGTAHVDLLCGGFPCQDLSVAGQRRGLMHEGGRSNLFFEFARIAESLRPRWVLVENVPGLLSSQGGRDFGVVLGTLADVGYGLAWRVLDSRFFGVPQRRRRVFIVGALAVGDPRAAAERAGEVLAVGARCQGHPATRGEAGADVAVASLSGFGTGGPDDNDGQAGRLVAATLVKPSHGASWKGNASDNLIAVPLSHGSNPNSNAAGRRREDDENLVATSLTMAQDPISAVELAQPSTGRHGDPGHVQVGASVRRLMPVECERLQALPDNWTAPAEIGGPPAWAHRLGNRHDRRHGRAVERARLQALRGRPLEFDANKDSVADSKRYAALGDAVTASVAEWIGTRLIMAS